MRYHSRRLIHRAGLALALCWVNYPAIAATLPEVVGKVLREHPDIQTSQALLNAAEEQLNQARSNFYPTAGLDAVATDTQFGAPLERTSRRTDAYLRWNLFRGQADRQGVKAAEYSRGAADADREETHEQVALQVAETYLELLRLRRLLALGEEYNADLLRLNDTMRKREEAGRVPTADLDQVRISLIQAEAQQAQLRGQLRGAEQRFRLLVGTEPGELSEPAIADAAASLGREALNEQVLSGNRRVRAAMERAAARAEEVGIAGGRLYPSLDLELRKRLQTEVNPVPVTDTKSSTQVQLSYQMPLGGANFSRKREALERQQAARSAAESELLRARSDLGLRWAAWQEVRNIAPQLAEQVEASQRVVRAFDLQFDAGRRSLTDLISSRGERYRAQADLIMNRIDQLAASARVLSLLGGLRQSLLADTPRPVLASPALAVLPAPAPIATPTPAPVSAPITAPVQEPVPAPAIISQEEVLRTQVQKWAAAWSANNFDAYSAFYAPSFEPGGGISNKTWQSQRRQRLSKPGKIEVTIDAMKVRFSSEDTAVVEFHQTYRSADYKDVMTKTLLWKNIDGRWLITKEFKTN